MIIDTGFDKPIFVRQPRYRLHEAPIMKKKLEYLKK